MLPARPSDGMSFSILTLNCGGRPTTRPSFERRDTEAELPWNNDPDAFTWDNSGTDRITAEEMRS
jgi:hypothetical protein